MIPTFYRVYETENTIMPFPDLTRLVDVAFRISQKPEYRDHQMTAGMVMNQLFQVYRKTHTEGGICCGMVCTWASHYQATQDPTARVDAVEANQLQAAYEMTNFKRSMMDKEHKESVAKEKMFLSKGLELNTIRVTPPEDPSDKELPPPVQEYKGKYEKYDKFPLDIELFKETTNRIFEWVEIFENLPFLLTVHPKGGTHALGLLHHTKGKDTGHYFLEPNQGLFRFKQGARGQALKEVSGHLAYLVPPGSPFKLKAIVTEDKQAAAPATSPRRNVAFGGYRTKIALAGHRAKPVI